MRLTAIAIFLLLAPGGVAAQSSPCVAPPGALSFDPYKPSHLAIVRNYGGAVLAQAPVGGLLHLDPYVPSEAALLRQLGSGIPAWGYLTWPMWPPAQMMEPCSASETPEHVESATAPLRSFGDMMARLHDGVPAGRPAPAPAAAPSRGITIQHAGRVWISAGPAVVFQTSEFTRVGERDGSPIFRRMRGENNVVYIPTTPGMVAPFRAAP
jgi:hypothetical protein